MNRRRFLAGTSVATASIMYGNISIQPSISASQSLQTPDPNELTNNIQFNISSFKLGGQNLPSDGRLDIKYKLIDTDRETTVKTTDTISESYRGDSANISVSGVNIDATTSEVTVLNNHKLKLVIELYDSDSNKQLSKKDETNSFLLEHILLNRTDPLNTTDDLAGWWPLHDDSARDYSGNGNHGTVNGATSGVSRKGVLRRLTSKARTTKIFLLGRKSTTCLPTPQYRCLFGFIRPPTAIR